MTIKYLTFLEQFKLIFYIYLPMVCVHQILNATSEGCFVNDINGQYDDLSSSKSWSIHHLYSSCLSNLVCVMGCGNSGLLSFFDFLTSPYEKSLARVRPLVRHSGHGRIGIIEF
ncbi:Thyroglobulin [Manis pentadactyla]|nr:Thyroglobulin [Manis pentadactyla]